MHRGGFDRRTALKRGAIAAGMVWSAPAVKSMRILQATGSAAPQTTTTVTVPPPPEFDIGGTSQRRNFTGGFPTAGCDMSVISTVQMELAAHGAVQLFFGICAPAPVGTTTAVTGTFFLQLPPDGVSGTFTGTIHQEEIENEALFPVKMDFVLTISDGTGAYAGAHGLAEYHDRDIVVGAPGSQSLQFSGELTGGFDL